MFNAPLIDDQLAFRFAGEFERSESDLNYPTYESFARFDDFTTDTYYNLRGKLLFQPREMPETRALLSYSFAHDAPTLDDIGGPGLGFNFDDDRGDINDPVFSEARSTDVHNAGLEVTHDFSEALRLTSLTGFTHSFVDRPSVNEGTPGESNILAGDRTDLQATQEVRLNYEGDRWRWVGGLYAAYEDLDAHFDRRSFDFRDDRSRSAQQTTNLAVFGEVTYEFVPTWKATLGGRLDYTTQETSEFFSRAQPLGTAPVVLTDFTAEFDEVNFLPKVGISKDFREFHTAGFTYSQGFRTGGVGLRSGQRRYLHVRAGKGVDL